MNNIPVIPACTCSCFLFYDMNWLFFCGWMFLFCIIVVIVVSLATKAPTAEKIQGLVFGTATKEQIFECRICYFTCIAIIYFCTEAS